MQIFHKGFVCLLWVMAVFIVSGCTQGPTYSPALDQKEMSCTLSDKKLYLTQTGSTKVRPTVHYALRYVGCKVDRKDISLVPLIIYEYGGQSTNTHMTDPAFRESRGSTGRNPLDTLGSLPLYQDALGRFKVNAYLDRYEWGKEPSVESIPVYKVKIITPSDSSVRAWLPEKIVYEAVLEKDDKRF
jgi:hypothetical protein